MWHVAKCWKNDKSGEDTCHRIRDGNSQSVPAITVKSKIWDRGIEELAFFQFKSWNGSSLTKVSEVHGQKHIVNVSCCLVHSLIWLFELSGQMVWLWVLQNVVVVGVVTGHRHQRTKANADGVKDLSCGINPDLKYTVRNLTSHILKPKYWIFVKSEYCIDLHIQEFVPFWNDEEAYAINGSR